MPLGAITDLLDRSSSLYEFKELAPEVLEANTQLFENEIGNPTSYMHEAADIIVPSETEAGRAFIHETFQPGQEEEIEKILLASGVGYIPLSARSAEYSVRELPIVAMPLLSHNMLPKTAKTIGAHFLAPILQRLYDGTGLVPSQETLENLVHIESLQQPLFKEDAIEVAVKFIPPYDLLEVTPEEFVARALKSAVNYGVLAGETLGDHLDPK